MTTPVQLTDNAAKRVAAILSGEPASVAFRIGVEGGGCSGFQYSFAIDGAKPDDTVIERGGARVVIDAVSLGYLGGASIDFIDDLMGQSFRIDNPNATASCGCGTSFSV